MPYHILHYVKRSNPYDKESFELFPVFEGNSISFILDVQLFKKN